MPFANRIAVGSSDRRSFFDELVTPNVDTEYGPIYVGGARAVGISLFAVTKHFTISFLFSRDPDGAFKMGTHQIEMREFDSFNNHIPVMGSWLFIYVSPSAAGSQLTLKVWAGPEIARHNSLNALGSVLFPNLGTVVAPGTTDFHCNRLWPGEAIFYMEFPATVCDITLRVVDKSGVQTQIARAVGANTQVERRTYLPPMHLMVRVINTAGGNQTVGFLLLGNSEIV